MSNDNVVMRGTKMNQTAKAKWVEALRSGEFQQGQGSLKRLNSDGSFGHCCLGVLCEVYIKEHPPTSLTWVPSLLNENTLAIGTKTDYLPLPVMQWAGLPAAYGTVLVCSLPDLKNPGQIVNTKKAMPVLNDSYRVPFAELADMIEAQL